MNDKLMVNINNYISKRPHSYWGYFAKGLVYLDEYLSKNLDRDIPYERCGEMLEAFSKSYKHMRNIRNLKYLCIALAISGRDSEFINIAQSSMSKSYIEKDQLVVVDFYRLVLKNGGRPEKMPEFGKNELDGEDYILFHLIKIKCKVDVFFRYNYLLKSIVKGRSSSILCESVFTKTDVTNELNEKFVNRFARYIKLIKSSGIYETIYKKKLITVFTKENIDLVDNIFILGVYKYSSKILDDGWLEKYIKFCLYENHSNKNVVKIIRNICQDKKVAAQLNIISGNKGTTDDSVLKEYFELQTHFAKDELTYYDSKTDLSNWHKRYNLYQVEIAKKDIWRLGKTTIKIITSFKNYQQKEIFEYYTGVPNYYYLPEGPETIKLINKGEVIEARDFKICQYYPEEVYNYMEAQDYLRLNLNISQQSNRFTLYILATSSKTIIPANGYLIAEIIKNKNLFSSVAFDNFLIKILNNKLVIYDDKIEATLKYEGLKRFFNEKSLNEYLLVESDVSNLTDVMLLSRRLNINVQINTFLQVVKTALEGQFDYKMAFLCEEFIYNNSIVNADLLDYLDMAYSNKNLITEYTDTVVKIISNYSDYKDVNNRIIVSNYVNRGKYDYEFSKFFSKVFSTVGPKSKFIKRIVNKIIHQKKYYDDGLIYILEQVYEHDQENILLLEEIVYRRIIKTRPVADEYLEKLKNCYISNPVFDYKSVVILYHIAKSKPEGIEELFAELLKYEFIESEYMDNIINSQNNGENRLNSINIFKVGYSEYYINNNNKKVLRNMIRLSKGKFIEWYDKVKDEEFRLFAGFVCVQNGVYNKNILLDYVANCPHEDMEKTYKLLIKNLLEEDVDQSIKVIEDYLQKLNQPYKIIGMLDHLAEKDLGKALDVFVRLHDFNHDGMKLLGQKLVKLALENNLAEKVIAVFEIFKELLHLPKWYELLLEYLRISEPLSNTSTQIIVNTYTKIVNKENLKQFRQVLINRKGEIVLANILFELYMYDNYEEFATRIISICTIEPESCNAQLISFVINSFRLKESRLRPFIERCHVSNEISDTVFSAAEDNFEVNRNFSIYLLRKISAYSPKAQKVLYHLEGSNDIIGRFVISKKSPKADFCSPCECLDIFTEETSVVIWVNENYKKIYEDFLQKTKVKSYKNIANYYVFSNYKALKLADEPISVSEAVKYTLHMTGFIQDMLKSGFIFVDVYPENTFIVDGTMVPVCIKKVYPFVKHARVIEDIRYLTKKQKLKKAKKSTFMDVYEKDAAEILLFLLKDLLKEDYKNISSLVDLIHNFKCETIQDLINEIQYIHKGVSTARDDADTPANLIDRFEFLDDNQKYAVLEYAINKDIYTKEIYMEVMQNLEKFDIQLSFPYISKYFDSNNTEILKAVYIHFLPYAQKNFIDKDIPGSKFILTFIKACKKHMSCIPVNEVTAAIDKMKFITEDVKEIINIS